MFSRNLIDKPDNCVAYCWNCWNSVIGFLKRKMAKQPSQNPSEPSLMTYGFFPVSVSSFSFFLLQHVQNIG